MQPEINSPVSFVRTRAFLAVAVLAGTFSLRTQNNTLMAPRGNLLRRRLPIDGNFVLLSSATRSPAYRRSSRSYSIALGGNGHPAHERPVGGCCSEGNPDQSDATGLAKRCSRLRKTTLQAQSNPITERQELFLNIYCGHGRWRMGFGRTEMQLALGSRRRGSAFIR